MNTKREVISCDFLVAGGGIAGMCAAIAAARKGLSVVLVNDRSVLGGNSSSEIGVGISGASHHGLNPAIYAKETGIVEEMRLRISAYMNGGGYGKPAALDAVFFDMIYNESNIRLLMNTIVYDCETDNGEIKKAYARHCVSNNLFEITAHSYADATGNGVLGAAAGAEFKMGREGREEFNEYWAPESADTFTMGNSIYFETEDAGREEGFTPPDFAHDISKMDFLKDINKPENFRGLSCFGPHWAYEYGGQTDILNDHDLTELELRKLIYGIWDYVKNSGKYPQAKTRRLKRVFAKAGTRESRRFVGDYMLNENDIEGKVNFEDSVAIGGWPMDIHAPLGIYDTLPASNFVPVTGTYNIPFRCLYSRNIHNLYLAGRDISASHIALGSTRVMATCGAIGQAVGTAAFLGKQYNKFPREIYKEHINELRELLTDDDQSILHIKEKSLNAEACASSEKAYENVSESELIPLERAYCLALMLDSDILKELKIKLKSSGAAMLKYKIYTGTHPETFLPEKLEKCCEISINDDFYGWLTIPVSTPVGADGKLYLVFEENPAIQLAVGKRRTMGAVTLRMHTRDNHENKNHDSVPLDEEKTGYTHFDHHYEKQRNILFKDICPSQSVFSAQNLLNGYSRPYGVQNLWLADMNSPQTVVLSLAEAQDISRLKIIFDDRLDIDEGVAMPSTLAKAFEVKIHHKDGIKTINESSNYRRMVRYNVSLSSVTKIELTVFASYGDEVGVYSISCS